MIVTPLRKVTPLRALAALALTAALAACGGKAMFTVQGSIATLNNAGMVLQYNGGNDLAVPAGATSFAFANQIAYGTDYNITILKNADHMHCSISNPSGSAGHTIVIAAAVSCEQNYASLGGQVKGLTVAANATATPPVNGLVLTNGTGGGTAIIAPAADLSGSTVEFAFATPVFYGQAYGVTVLTQPTGQFCTVTNGTGVMFDNAVSNVLVNCVKTP